MHAVRLGAIVVATALAAGCAAAPPGLERIRVEWGLQTNDIIAVPGGGSVLVQTAGGGPFPRLLVWDESLRTVARLPCNIATVGPSADGSHALLTDILEMRVLRLPDLAVEATLAWPKDYIPLSVWHVAARRDGGWAVVEPSSGVLRVDDGPPHVGPQGTTFHPGPGLGVVDDATGLLVLRTGPIAIGAFDLGTMTTSFVAPLPSENLAFDVAAACGLAWVATDDGTGSVLEFDLRTRSMRGRYETGLAGEVDLGLSSDRRHLVTLTRADRFEDVKARPVRLRVFAVSHSGLAEEASLASHLPCTPFDVEIVPEWGTVFIAGQQTFAWRYAPPKQGD